MLGLNELLLLIVSAVVYFLAFAFAVATGVYLGTKWTKRGNLPTVLQFLDSNKKDK